MKERQRNKQGMRCGRRPLNAVVHSSTDVKVPLHDLVGFEGLLRRASRQLQ